MSQQLQGLHNSPKRPMCAVCGHEVETITVEQDLFQRAWTIVVGCHGKAEEMTLTESQMMQFRSIEAGVAFQKEADARARRSDESIDRFGIRRRQAGK